MKKLLGLIFFGVSLLPMSSCDFTPPYPADIQAFVDQFNYSDALENHQAGTYVYKAYTARCDNFDETDEKTGTIERTYTYELNDINHAQTRETYWGDQIPTYGDKKGVVRFEEILDNTLLTTTTTLDGASTSETKTDVLTENERNYYLQQFFYTNYDDVDGYQGGCYYGDYLKGASTLTNFISINEEEQTLEINFGFEEDVMIDTQEQIYMAWHLKVDKYGMALSYIQKMWSIDRLVYSEFNVTYR